MAFWSFQVSAKRSAQMSSNSFQSLGGGSSIVASVGMRGGTVRVARLTRLRIVHGRWKMSPQFLCHDASESDLNCLAGRNPMRMIPLAAAAFVASTSAVAQSWEEYSYPEYECAFAVVV